MDITLELYQWLLGAVIWLSCAYYAYYLERRWMLNCEAQPHWRKGEYWTTGWKIGLAMMALLAGPFDLVISLVMFSRLKYPDREKIHD